MKHQVLLVDDDDDESLFRSLRQFHPSETCEVFLAGNVQEVIERADAGEIDLLLMKLDSPTDDWWEVIDEITEENPFLPVIVVSNQPELRNLAEAAGARAFVETPVELRALLQAMEAVLHDAAEQRVQGISEHECDFRHVRSSQEKRHEDSLVRADFAMSHANERN